MSAFEQLYCAWLLKLKYPPTTLSLPVNYTVEEVTDKVKEFAMKMMEKLRKETNMRNIKVTASPNRFYDVKVTLIKRIAIRGRLLLSYSNYGSVTIRIGD